MRIASWTSASVAPASYASPTSAAVSSSGRARTVRAMWRSACILASKPSDEPTLTVLDERRELRSRPLQERGGKRAVRVHAEEAVVGRRDRGGEHLALGAADRGARKVVDEELVGQPAQVHAEAWRQVGARGCRAALNLTPRLGAHLRGLADELLVDDWRAPHSSGRARCCATAVSRGNDCFFCMDSHGARATCRARRHAGRVAQAIRREDARAPSRPARAHGGGRRDRKEQPERPMPTSSSPSSAAGFSMYNRMVTTGSAP